MCGRFAMTGDLDFYRGYYAIDSVATDPLDPSWNLAPTDESYVMGERNGRRELTGMPWGLIPHWAENARTIHINARLETVATKPAFKRALSRHRCIVPADGFYEWEPPEKGRTPHWVHRADGHPMSFAAIWSAWQDPADGDWTRRFAIVTTRAEGIIARIHDRMPVMLADDAWGSWLDPAVEDPREALSLIRTVEPDLIMEHTVSSAVNSVRNNSPGLTDPFTETLF